MNFFDHTCDHQLWSESMSRSTNWSSSTATASSDKVQMLKKYTKCPSHICHMCHTMCHMCVTCVTCVTFVICATCVCHMCHICVIYVCRMCNMFHSSHLSYMPHDVSHVSYVPHNMSYVCLQYFILRASSPSSETF